MALPAADLPLADTDAAAALRSEAGRQLARLVEVVPGAARVDDDDDRLVYRWTSGGGDWQLSALIDHTDEGLGLRLVILGENGEEELLALRWPAGAGPGRRGLSGAVERRGRYAGKDGLGQLRRDLASMFGGGAVVPWPTASLPEVAEAIAEPATRQIATVPLPTAPEPDAVPSLLDAAAQLLPDELKLEQARWGAFVANAARCGGRIDQDALASLTQHILADHIAALDAYLHGRSPLTAAALASRHLAQGLGLLVALSSETMTGVFAFGPLIGSSLAAAPLAGVGAFLLGGGLLPLLKGKGARAAGLAVAVLWGASVAALTARNPDLAGPMQALMPSYQQIDAGERSTHQQALQQVLAARQRETEARAGLAASKQLELQAKERWQSSVKSSRAALQDAEAQRQQAESAFIPAEARWQALLANHPSRREAEALLFLLTSIMNAVGPLVLGLYFGGRDEAHAAGLDAARRRRKLKTRLKALRSSEAAQRSAADILLAEMKAQYVASLVNERRLSAREAESLAERSFAPLAAISDRAVAGLRQSLGCKPAKPRPATLTAN